MIAAFRDLQIRIVARRQLDALCGDQIDKRLVFGRQVLVHRGHHFLVALRAGDLQYLRMAVENLLRLRAQAAGDDDFAVLRERLADGFQRFIHRRIDESAGVDHHQVGRAVTGHHFIPLGTQARQDTFGIDQCFGAAQADKAHFRAFAFDGFHASFKGWESGANCTP